MGSYKLLFTGPVGAGKSTAIRSISDGEALSTDELATDETRQRKQQTTVAMDYGTIRLPGDEVVHVYGTPGQDRFDFMWEILQEGALGLVIMVDNARPEPVDDLLHFVHAYRDFIDATALAVGVTRVDLAPRPGLAAYHDALRTCGLRAPVFTVDARRRDDVSLLLQALLLSLDLGMVA